GCRFRWTGRGTADGPHEPGRPEHVRHAGARPLLHRPHHACARNDLPVRPRALRPGLRPADRIPMITRTQRALYRTASLIVVTAVCAGCTPGTSRGPPECPGRAYCLPGLKHSYGLRFKSFIPLDAGGPLTLQALDAGDIDVALPFS